MPDPPAGAFGAARSDTVKLSVAELKRQLEAHGFRDVAEQDVAVPESEDTASRLRRLVDD